MHGMVAMTKIPLMKKMFSDMAIKKFNMNFAAGIVITLL